MKEELGGGGGECIEFWTLSWLDDFVALALLSLVTALATLILLKSAKLALTFSAMNMASVMLLIQSSRSALFAALRYRTPLAWAEAYSYGVRGEGVRNVDKKC